MNKLKISIEIEYEKPINNKIKDTVIDTYRKIKIPKDESNKWKHISYTIVEK